MGVWNWWSKHVKQTTGDREQNLLLPESDEKISKEAILNRLTDIDDLETLELVVGHEPVTILYLKTLVDKKTFQSMILDPLTYLTDKTVQDVIKSAEFVEENDLPLLMQRLLMGFTVIISENRGITLVVDTLSPTIRSIASSESESTVLGPQESFVESLQTCISQIRRRIISPHLKVRTFIVGTETRNYAAVLYLDHIAHPENVERVLSRIRNVEFHGFVGLPLLKQMIEDKPYSPFPQFNLTTRPDNAVAALLDGRILVAINGSPDMIICPSSFLEMFNSQEDFYNRWSTATLLRLIRFAGWFISVLLTSSYVSVLTYHPEMLPPALLTILAESRSRVPFPPVIEVLIIEGVIEVLREAGVRMPTKIGQTIGIVGGIVIGTAAVEAGLASNVLIVVVSVSALLSFLPPNFLMSNAIRVVRYIFILSAGLLGMYGQMLALAFIYAHLSNLTSLGTPYMTPGFPRKWTDVANSIFRSPVTFLMTRSGMSRAQQQKIRPTDEE